MYRSLHKIHGALPQEVCSAVGRKEQESRCPGPHSPILWLRGHSTRSLKWEGSVWLGNPHFLVSGYNSLLPKDNTAKWLGAFGIRQPVSDSWSLLPVSCGRSLSLSGVSLHSDNRHQSCGAAPGVLGHHAEQVTLATQLLSYCLLEKLTRTRSCILNLNSCGYTFFTFVTLCFLVFEKTLQRPFICLADPFKAYVYFCFISSSKSTIS